MAITTYDELKSAIADWLARDDLTTRIPDFISLAEKQISRDLRSRDMVTRKELSTVAGTAYYPLPDRYLQQRDFHINTSTGKTALIPLSPVAIDSRTSGNTPGCPRFYQIFGRQLEISPIPDDIYTIQMTYYEEPNPLSDLNPTNAFITNFPDLILYSSLLQATPYIQDDARINLWQGAYIAIIQQENKSTKKGQYGPAPAMTPSFGTVV